MDELLKIAESSGCTDLGHCRQVLLQAIDEQRSAVRAVLDARIVPEGEFLRRLSEWLEIPWWQEPLVSVAAPLREKVLARVAVRCQIVPLQEDDAGIWIALYDPFDLLTRQMLAHSLGQPVLYAMSTRSQILQALRQGYGIGAETFEAILEGRDQEDLNDELRQETNVLDQEDSEASVVKFVNQILREGLDQPATDIHVEPMADDLRIR
ncbi:MAG: type II/IV secretion system protein, partial [Verrucomicrobia bacterium]|nr:type II/IV secretion system protein [Verrucomicrobiota bacterium]